MSIDEILSDKIREIAKDVIQGVLQPVELFADLPDVSKSAEVAAVFDVSTEVLHRSAENGLPHVHLGREMRFLKRLLIEHAVTGKLFYCEACRTKVKPEDMPEQSGSYQLPVETSIKLAKFAKRI
jgi:hypothetical protein